MKPSEAYRASRSAKGEMLTAALEHETLVRVSLRREEMLDGRTWTATVVGSKTSVPLSSVAPCTGDESVYISIRQLKDGRHEFVALTEAMSGANPLTLLDEADVKSRFCPRLFYARGAAVASGPSSEGPSTTWDHPDLAPHGTWTNYSIIPWLCVGRTNAMMLCDEETRGLRGHRIRFASARA